MDGGGSVAKSDETFARTKADVAAHRQRIQDAGGTLTYCMNYIEHLARLKDGGEHFVISEHRASYPRMAVQIAAVSALQNAMGSNVDVEDLKEVEKWARAAWIHSAGHYSGQSSEKTDSEIIEHPNANSMAMIRRGADGRKAKAAEQWDRLANTNTESLMSLAVFGHETAKPVNRKDGLIGLASLIALIAAVIAYGASNWYLSAKITAPYDTAEGLQQRRDATERFLAYDKMMSARSRRGGMIKLFLDWPMSPTAAEKDAFIEFGRNILSLNKALSEEEVICNKSSIEDDKVYEFIDKVNDNINMNDDIIGSFNRTESIIIRSLMRIYPDDC